METRRKFEDLAETIFFCGLNRDRLQEIGFQLKEWKTFKDINEAVQNGRMEGIGEFDREIACIGRRLQEVVEIREIVKT